MSIFIKGDLIVLDVWDGAIYRPVVCLTSNGVSETVNVIESQTKCLPGAIEKDAGSYSYEISIEGQKIDTTSAGSEVTKASYDYLKTLLRTKALVTWRTDTGSVDTPYEYGTGILSDLSDGNDAGDSLSTFSGTLSGSGLIVTVDPNA